MTRKRAVKLLMARGYSRNRANRIMQSKAPGDSNLRAYRTYLRCDSVCDMVARDNARTFMNLDEFAEKRIVVYDGVTYDGEDHAGIPVVLSGLKEKDRRQLMSDHIQGLFLVSSVLHCRIQDLGGNQPEKGTRMEISDPDDATFFRRFYVASSVCELGLLRVELEAFNE